MMKKLLIRGLGGCQPQEGGNDAAGNAGGNNAAAENEAAAEE